MSMTECERIRKEGILPDSFFKPETICDFYVDETRKKIWAVELDLLLQVSKICKKYNLKYFLCWGSLLGAVRHGGFVPWDDDLDVAMPRKDYEEFLTHAAEFPEPYFLQTPFSDPGYYYSHAKLRNSNTAALDYPFLFQGFNMGIFIDILPLDEIDRKEGMQIFDNVTQLIQENNVAMRLTHPYLNERDRKRVSEYKGGDPLENYNKMQNLAKVSAKSSDVQCSLLMAVVYGYSRDVWEKSCFDGLMEVKLYNSISTYIPKMYDVILKKTYGDYMKFPPVEKRGVWHNNVVFLPDCPYKEALKHWEDYYDKNHPNVLQMTSCK